MTPGLVSKQIVLERLAWIDRMVAEIRKLWMIRFRSKKCGKSISM